MLKFLTEAQIAQYRVDGFLAPVRVIGEDAAFALRAKLEAVEAGMGGPSPGGADPSRKC
jgi:hypothetical protein